MIRQINAGARGSIYSVAVLILLLLVGCTTVSSMREKQQESGTTAAYHSSYADAFGAVVLACESLRLRVADKNFEEKYLIATSGGSANGLCINYGEVIGVYLEEFTGNQIDISTVNKRKYKPGFLYSNDWTNDLHSAIYTYVTRKK